MDTSTVSPWGYVLFDDRAVHRGHDLDPRPLSIFLAINFLVLADLLGFGFHKGDILFTDLPGSQRALCRW